MLRIGHQFSTAYGSLTTRHSTVPDQFNQAEKPGAAIGASF
jgi:hypothetical protein